MKPLIINMDNAEEQLTGVMQKLDLYDRTFFSKESKEISELLWTAIGRKRVAWHIMVAKYGEATYDKQRVEMATHLARLVDNHEFKAQSKDYFVSGDDSNRVLVDGLTTAGADSFFLPFKERMYLLVLSGDTYFNKSSFELIVPVGSQYLAVGQTSIEHVRNVFDARWRSVFGDAIYEGNLMNFFEHQNELHDDTNYTDEFYQLQDILRENGDRDIFFDLKELGGLGRKTAIIGTDEVDNKILFYEGTK